MKNWNAAKSASTDQIPAWALALPPRVLVQNADSGRLWVHRLGNSYLVIMPTVFSASLCCNITAL